MRRRGPERVTAHGLTGRLANLSRAGAVMLVSPVFGAFRTVVGKRLPRDVTDHPLQPLGGLAGAIFSSATEIHRALDRQTSCWLGGEAYDAMESPCGVYLFFY